MNLNIHIHIHTHKNIYILEISFKLKETFGLSLLQIHTTVTNVGTEERIVSE